MSVQKNSRRINGNGRANGHANGKVDPPSNAALHASSQGNKEREIAPGEHPLPDDPAEFVQEIHGKIDLAEVWHILLRSRDTKIKQRAAERLTDLLYKGAATSLEEQQQIIFDLPRPKRD